MSFVYSIHSAATSRIYFGASSMSVERRFGYHQAHLRHYHHPNVELQACHDEHGLSDLTFAVILDGLTKAEAKGLETQLIANTPPSRIFNVRGVKSKSAPFRRLDIDPNEILALRGTMKQYQIAQRLGCSPSYVSQVMRGMDSPAYYEYLTMRKSASSAHFH